MSLSPPPKPLLRMEHYRSNNLRFALPFPPFVLAIPEAGAYVTVGLPPPLPHYTREHVIRLLYERLLVSLPPLLPLIPGSLLY